MKQLIPLIASARQSLSVRLDNQDVRITLFWQPSDQNWYVNIESPTNTQMVSGRRIVQDEKLVNQPHLFRGEIVCEKTQSAELPIGRNAWAETHRLVFRG